MHQVINKLIEVHDNSSTITLTKSTLVIKRDIRGQELIAPITPDTILL